MNLDTNRILNTDSKVLVNAFAELAKGENTIEDANKYKDLYKDKPLSFILENSEKIFAEPRLGLPFYRGVVIYFPLFALKNELEKVHHYIHEHKNFMHPMLLKDYEDLCGYMKDKVHEKANFAVIEDVILTKHPEDRARIMVMCDLLRTAGDDCDGHEIDEPKCDHQGLHGHDHLKSFNDLNKLVGSMNPIITLIYAATSSKKHILSQCGRNIAKALSSGHLVKTMEAAIQVNYMSGSPLFEEAINNIRSADARCILQGLAEMDITSEFNTYTESVLDTGNIPMTLDNYLEAAMATIQEDRITAEESAETQSSLLQDKLTIYESVMDIVKAIYDNEEPTSMMVEFPIFTQIKNASGITEAVNVEDALKIIVEATAEIESELGEITQEYTIDGRPGSILTRHSTSTIYGENPKKGISNRPKGSAPSRNGASNSSDDYDDEEEDDEDDVRDGNIPQGSRYKRGSEGMPDNSNPNNTKPQKPKQGFLDKVTTKAMDADAKSKQTASKLKSAGQAVATAGKAVLRIPAGIVKSVMSLPATFSKMDDNRRKEYMIQPGYRKKIFKNLRVALMYYTAFNLKAIYLPITWFARQLSKSKNKRIRNEFVAELETEIKVTEAKIEDAAGKGDQEQKYQLMRIRDKLNLDLQRVKYNARNL